MCGLKQNFARLWFDDSGVSSVEYALLLAVAAASIIVAAATLSNSVQNEIIDAADCITFPPIQVVEGQVLARPA